MFLTHLNLPMIRTPFFPSSFLFTYTEFLDISTQLQMITVSYLLLVALVLSIFSQIHLIGQDAVLLIQPTMHQNLPMMHQNPPTMHQNLPLMHQLKDYFVIWRTTTRLLLVCEKLQRTEEQKLFQFLQKK